MSFPFRSENKPGLLRIAKLYRGDEAVARKYFRLAVSFPARSSPLISASSIGCRFNPIGETVERTVERRIVRSDHAKSAQFYFDNHEEITRLLARSAQVSLWRVNAAQHQTWRSIWRPIGFFKNLQILPKPFFNSRLRPLKEKRGAAAWVPFFLSFIKTHGCASRIIL